MLKKLTSLLCFSLLLCCAAYAQVRNIPADAKRAVFAAQEFPLVQLNGETFRLAPGARIYTTDNLFSTPNMAPQNVEVKYKLNSQGQVQTIWILTAQERAAK